MADNETTNGVDGDDDARNLKIRAIGTYHPLSHPLSFYLDTQLKQKNYLDTCKHLTKCKDHIHKIT